ncbi:MAG: DNA-deoxyinosine glycosylase [Novosphingobium sp.]
MWESAYWVRTLKSDCRVLILGSLPGAMSLAQQQYYGNPRNQFWAILGNLLEADLTSLTYQDRLSAIAARGIGLWDCIGSAQRRGSLDSAIRHAEANPLAALAERLPDLRAVAFNGGASARLGLPQLADFPHIASFALPSTSPAHTLPLSAKIAAWRVLLPWLGGG